MDYLGVLGIFKNETHIIREWILHYIHHGIDKIYILNDGSTDDFMSKIGDLLIKFKERIQLKNVGSKDQGEKWPGRQIHLYNKYFSNSLKEVYWLGVFDMDEFMWCPYSMNLTKCISAFEKYDEIIVPWQCFGSNDHLLQPLSAVKYFTKKAEKPLSYYNVPEYSEKHWHYKSFAKTFKIKEIRHHLNILHNVNPDWISKERFHYCKGLRLEHSNQLQLNHYMCQSKSHYFNVKSKTISCEGNLEITNGKKNGTLFPKIDLNETEDNGLWEQNKLFQKELLKF